MKKGREAHVSMEFDVMNILMDIAVILLATKLLGMLTRKLGLPQVA